MENSNKKMPERVRLILMNTARALCLLIVGGVYLGVALQSVRAGWTVLLTAAAGLGIVLLTAARRSEKQAFACGFTAMVAVQLLLGFILEMEFKTWDVYIVTKTAKAMIDDSYINHAYFAQYPNNIALTLLFNWIFQASNALTGNMQQYLLTVLNIAAIDTAVLLSVATLRHTAGERTACRAGLLMTMFAPLYLYTPITYTDTFAMPIIAAIMYLTVRVLRARQNGRFGWKQIAACAAIGGLLAYGYALKGSIAVFGVAVVICMVMRFRLRQLVRPLASIGAGLLVMLVIHGAVVDASELVEKDLYDRYQFPVTHWIMMGLGGQGNFNNDDVKFTASFETYAEKKEAVMGKIKERVQEKGLLGVLKHYYSKAATYGWNYGTFYAERYLGDQGDMPVARNPIHEVVLTKGAYHGGFYTVTQGLWLLIMGAAALGMLLGLRQGTERSAELLLYQIPVLGVMLFFMLWEAHPRYILHASLAVVMLAALALDKAAALVDGALCRRSAAPEKNAD